MSWTHADEPECTELGTDAVELVIDARPRDVGGFVVGRVLPAVGRRTVGPFSFFDHLMRIDFAPDHGIDVRPHPHIGLATVTYLFEGEIVHRDSLGFEQAIRPGEVNWMLAARGVVHSERTGAERRKTGGPLHGIQSWVALPLANEESEPRFDHHPGSSVPRVDREGAQLRVVAGHAYGARSPVAVLSPTLYVDAQLEEGAVLPLPDEHQERAAFVIEGEVGCDDHTFEPGRMLIFRPGARASLRARRATRLMLLGGAPLDGARHVYWNFVSSSKERIERAKREWKERRFPVVPRDATEFIPLPQ